MPIDEPSLIELLLTPRLSAHVEPAATPISFEFDFDSHYDVLGVPRNATPEQLDTAKFALRKHYDSAARNNSDARAASRLVLITNAQDVLTRPDKRKEYDQRPEVGFLSIQEPYEDQPLDWETGLALIRELTADANGELLSPHDAAPPERANAMLDKLLE